MPPVALAILLFVLPCLHGAEIVMVDVGQGDAFLVRDGPRAVLVDTGNQDAAVLKGLARHDVHHLDAIMLSHSDDDHVGALSAILDHVDVECVLIAQDMLSCPCANCAQVRAMCPEGKLCGLARGDVIAFGHVRASVIGPKQFAHDGGNEDSLTVRFGFDARGDGAEDAAALFSGDAEADVLDPLAREGEFGHVDVLKVPHHGSADALSDSLLDSLAPDIALISVGKDNTYGHPNVQTLEMLEDHGVRIFRSDEDGDVVCNMAPAPLRQKPFG